MVYRSTERAKMMDNQSEKQLAESVIRILEHADMNLMTESKVRKLAAEDTGLDLNISANRKVVKRIIEDFFSKNAEEESDDAGESGSGEEEDEDTKPAGKEKRRLLIDEEDSEEFEDKPSRKKRIVERNGEDDGKSRKPNASVRRVAKCEEEDTEASSENEVPTKKKGRSTFKKNDNGDIVVCQIAPKRFVTVQDFRGKMLVSIREYYEKDGKQLPGAKGVSLTVEQWENLKEGVPKIEAAIERIQQC